MYICFAGSGASQNIKVQPLSWFLVLVPVPFFGREPPLGPCPWLAGWLAGWVPASRDRRLRFDRIVTFCCTMLKELFLAGFFIGTFHKSQTCYDTTYYHVCMYISLLSSSHGCCWWSLFLRLLRTQRSIQYAFAWHVYEQPRRIVEEKSRG